MMQTLNFLFRQDKARCALINVVNVVNGAKPYSVQAVISAILSLTTTNGKAMRSGSAKAKIFQIKDLLWASYLVYFLSGYIILCPTWCIYA